MINKKDSGATVLHLPLSEKTKPVDGLMTDYCSNIHFFEYLGSSKSTEQITNKLINSNHFEKSKKVCILDLERQGNTNARGQVDYPIFRLANPIRTSPSSEGWKKENRK